MYYDEFEHLAAKFVSAAAIAVPEQLVSLLIASPLSARSSDLCMLWHPNYRRKHKGKLLLETLFSLGAACLKGLIRMTGKYKRFGYALYGRMEDALLVVPFNCAFEASDGQYRTPYVFTETGDAIFIFGPYDRCGRNAQKTEELLPGSKLSFLWILIGSGIYAFRKVDGNIYSKTLLLLKLLSWALSLRWLYDYYLQKVLSETIEKYNIRKLACIHEMHYYSRVVWRVASKYNVRSYAVQHAAVTEGKRWFFHYPEERNAGLVMPDLMYVFNKKMVEMFKPYYRNTNLQLGCSYRYARLKDIEASLNNKGRYYLFVSALPKFDNHVLINILCRLLASGLSVPVRFRFHPAASISFKDRCLIQSRLRRGLVAVSRDTPLESDIDNAIVVIGMGTTVLEEALLFGKPVIQLTHPDYLQYIDVGEVRGAVKKDYREFSAEDLLKAADMHVDYLQIRERLGLDQDIITYKRLFEGATNA